MAFSWGPAVGGFASGLGSGIQQGQQIQQNGLIQAGQQAWAQTLAQVPGAAPPAPAAGGIPGAQPMPQAAAPQPPAAQPGGTNALQGGGAPPPMQPPQGMPMPPQASAQPPQPPPQQPPQQPAQPPMSQGIPGGVASYPMKNHNDPAYAASMGGAPPRPPLVPQQGATAPPSPYQGTDVSTNNPNMPSIPDQYKQGFQVLQTMAKAIKAANPQASPGVIAAALATGVQQLQPMVKQQATDAFHYIMANQGQQKIPIAQQRADAETQNAGTRAQGEADRASASREKLAQSSQRLAQLSQQLADTKDFHTKQLLQRALEDEQRNYVAIRRAQVGAAGAAAATEGAAALE